MKSFILGLFVCACMSFGVASAQDCASGKCAMPVRNAVKAVVVPTAQVVRTVVSVPVKATKVVAQKTRRGFKAVRGCGCGCGR
jgi:hypothetical protein